MTTDAPADLDTLVEIVKANGYAVVKAPSHRRAQERQRIAEARAEYAAQDADKTRAWAVDCLTEERRLRDRLTFVYGVARARGATIEELNGETGFTEC